MIDQCESEIVELHEFFERWFGGQLDDSPEAFSRLSDVLSERFLMISPSGERRERRAVLESVRGRHGSHRGPGRSFSIEIENLEGRFRAGGLCLVTYDERQAIDGTSRTRASSALFREREGTPHGVEWLHLHETWLPRG
jgi:hypothetical protein